MVAEMDEEKLRVLAMKLVEYHKNYINRTTPYKTRLPDRSWTFESPERPVEPPVGSQVPYVKRGLSLENDFPEYVLSRTIWPSTGQ